MAADDQNSDNTGPLRAAIPKPEQDQLGLRLRAQRLLGEMFGIVESTHLGRYELMGEIGSGAMGIVYLAHDHELDRKVAIKTLRSPSDANLRRRLVDEARAMARVSHPNVATVFDTGSADGLVFIVMEHIEGVTLRTWLDTRQRSRAELLEVFTAAGEGLAAAHDEGLVHHDFKPSNVMIGEDGHVRVLDFGLARTDPGEEATVQYRPGQELPGVVIAGTPKYMAPEQLAGRWVDARSDQFAFCVSLYQALYDQHPYGDTHAKMWTAAERGELRSPPSGTQVPGWLRAVVVRGLASDPLRRFESMRKLLVQLVAGDPERAEDAERRSLRITFSLDYDLEKIDEVERARLQDLLRIVTGDRYLAIEGIARGSIIVTIDVTDRGANRLRRLYEERVLSGRLGLEVLRVDFMPRARRPALAKAQAMAAGADVPLDSDADMPLDPDLALLDAWVGGDRRAGNVLIGRHYIAIRKFFANRIDENAREDLVQETFRKLISRVNKYDRHSSFRTFLFSVAHNTLMDHLRRSYRNLKTVVSYPVEDSIADLDAVLPSQLVTDVTRHGMLLACMRALPVGTKQLLELYYWQDLSTGELAELFQVPHPTLRSRLVSARKRLAIDMQQHLGTDEPKDLDEQIRELLEFFQSGPPKE